MKNLRGILFGLALFLPVTGWSQQFLGYHPDAFAQPTTLGKTLHTLEVSNNKVFIGYGDYNVNTGPIHVRYFDPQSLTFSSQLATTNSEAIHRFGFDGNRIFALHTDPRTGWGPYASGLNDGTGWSDFNDPAMRFIHVYDFERVGSELFLAGSGGPTASENAVVYRSLDNGASWQVHLDSPSPLNGYDYSFSRYYGLGQLNGLMYTQQVVAYYNIVAGNYVLQKQDTLGVMTYNGTAWNQGPLMRTSDGLISRFFDPEETAGHLVFRSSHAGLSATRLFKFDGTLMEEIKFSRPDLTPAFTWDHFVDASGTYVLRNDGTVSFSEDLSNWFTLLTNLDPSYRSVTRLDNNLYFGDNGGGLHRHLFTAIPEPTTMTGLTVTVLVLATSFRPKRRIK